MKIIREVYDVLYERLGPQGWWPLTIKNNRSEHHAGQPKTKNQRFEVITGAVLTQNTNWKNVEMALYHLSRNNLIDPEKIRKIDHDRLARLIRPAGYYNQKAERLKIAAEFFLENKNPDREQLLDVKGIGPETADSILLYAYSKPFFVIDAYTKRIFEKLGFREKDYGGWQNLFMSHLPEDASLFNEYHALLVDLGKNHCKTKPVCGDCPIAGICKSFI